MEIRVIIHATSCQVTSRPPLIVYKGISTVEPLNPRPAISNLEGIYLRPTIKGR